MKNQEVAIKPTVKIVLDPDAELLEEVMVVAYGTAKKSAFTGSAAVVGSKELEKRITTNVADALVGSVPGLQIRGGSGAPGSSQGSINIRGIASMYASTDPLVVVDGAPYDANLSNIPQGDIESITVLKDAASAALYGARGAAGVILVTTKKGKTKEAQISVDMKWGANSRAVQEYETIKDPGQYYETAYKQYYNYYYYGQGQDATLANQNANKIMLQHLGYNIYKYPAGEQLIGLNGKLNPNAVMGNTIDYEGETYYLTADDWTDAAYHTAFRQEYNININGGTDRSNFYTSLGYLDEDGIIDHSGYQRFSARIKADYQARKWLKLGVNVGYINSATESNPNLDASQLGSTNLNYYTSMIAPIYPIYVRVLDANGNPVIRTDANGNPQYDYGRAGLDYPVNRAFLQTGNPLGSNEYNEVTSKGSQLNLSGTADVTITDFLKFNATSTANWGHTNYSDYETGLYGPKVSVNGQIDKSQTDVLRQTHTQTLTYFDSFGKHNVTAMVGHEWYDTKTTYLYAYGQGVFSPDVTEINGAASKVSSNSYTSEYNVEGWFGNAQYNYDEKYYGSLSFRRDASSRFAKENRWGNFWSVGGAWLLSKENFLKDIKWIDILKFKASIGQQGNDGLPFNWYYTDTYNLTASSATTMSPSLRYMGNKDITWETTTNFNVGVEFSLWKGRLSGSLEYYNKKTSDLLFWLSVPESMGTTGYYGNLGDIRNQGIELVLQGSVIRNKDIDWGLQFNLAHNTTKILSLPASKIANYGGFAETNNNIQMWYEEGKPLYNAFLFDYAGVDEYGQALYWYDEDLSPLGGKVSTNNTSKAGEKRSGTTTDYSQATRYAHGSLLPKVMGGFGTTLKLYNFDFSATFDYQIGGKVYDYHYAALMQNGTDAGDAGSAFHKDLLKSWTPDNTSSNIPRFQYTDKYTASSSSRWLTNASYLNFQSFTVGYTFPKSLMKDLGISQLRVYASGENLCFWSARKGLDPRYAYEGTEYLAPYSPVRTIMGGIQISF